MTRIRTYNYFKIKKKIVDKFLIWITSDSVIIFKKKKLQTFVKYIIGISFGISEERRKIYKL